MTNNNRATTRRLPVDQLREQASVIGHDMQELGSIAKDAAHEAIAEGRKVAQDAITRYNVQGTPTFVINGAIVQATEGTWPILKQKFDSLLPKK